MHMSSTWTSLLETCCHWLLSGCTCPSGKISFFYVTVIVIITITIFFILQCAGAAVASVILKGLDAEGYKAAAGASNQPNSDAGVTVGRALGFEIILT